MTVRLEIDEPPRQTFMEFLKTIPYVTVVAEEPAIDDDWTGETTRRFLAGYADADSIYNEL